MLDIISRIEKCDTIENIALQCHIPCNGVYVIVDKEFNFKIISKECFSFNSKYVVMDFYSQIINLNKSVDKKKLVTSNNYLTFFCKNFEKLTFDIIDDYYNRLGANEDGYIYKDWIKKNIFKISEKIPKNQIVKVFFMSEVENYINKGKEYFGKNIFSNTTIVDSKLYGSSLFLNLNSNKPFLKTLTRKTKCPSVIDLNISLKYKYLKDILFSFAKRGFDMLYVLENGELIKVSLKSGSLPNKSFVNAVSLVYKINNRGNLVLLDKDIIPKYNSQLN
ncbi:MAG: hypothetical protein RSC24_06240 [Clostridium sp.]